MRQLIELRDYQVRGKRMLYSEFKAGIMRPCWVFPTGAGKSTVSASFVKDCVAKGKRVLFFVHSKELVQQFAQRLAKQFGIYSGVIMAGIKPQYHLPVQVASIQTLVRRKPPKADVVIIDECHRSRASTYEKVLSWYPLARIVGLTATPFRKDGKPLGNIFQSIVHPVKIRELIQKGFLVSTKVYVPKAGEEVDLEGLDIRMGDFDKSALSERMSAASVVDGVVDNYKRFAKGKKMICFNVNVAHSKLTHEAFLAAGVASIHLDGETPKNERTAAVRAFRRGDIKVLHNVNLFTEGFDVPDTDGVILNRATQSEGMYVQMAGRGLRPATGKSECIILDHGGNTLRFGFVEDYDQRKFSLTDTEKETDPDGGIKPCKTCGNGVMRRTEETEDEIFYTCDNCEAEVSRNKKRKAEVVGATAEFVLLDRDASLIERIAAMPHHKVKAGHLPLSQIRIYQRLNNYQYAWALHTAIEAKLVDIDPHSPTKFKEFLFLVRIAEKEGDTERILAELKSQTTQKQVA